MGIGGVKMDYEEIKRLIQDVGNSKIDAIDIEFPEGIKISMKKKETITEKENRQESLATIPIIEKKQEEIAYKEVKSPMVGTFYQSSSPNADPFVKVGDKVKKGDTLCIIEAMKLMNEIEAEYDGEIAQICVSNEEIVDYGKVLFKIK